MDAVPEPNVSILAQVILIGVLTLMNAFFASAEMAIVSINKNKIRLLSENGNKKAKLIEKLIEEPTKFLSTIQVGITFAGFFASASAATGISEQLGNYLCEVGIPYGNNVAFIGITILLSYITLVFGELFPKRIALQKSETIAMFSVKPIIIISKIASPFIKILSLSTSLLLKITGMDSENLEEKVSKEEIKSLVEVGQEHGVINETEKEMINSIFEFDDKLAKEVMTPRTEVYLINIDLSIDEYLDELLAMKYSRIPVYEGDIDNIIGILYIKDYIVEAKKYGFNNVDVRSILQKPYFVPESKNIDELFKELQGTKKHIAILIDEYGGFAGIATIEDLIEEVMGNIEDEYDDEEPEISKLDSNKFLIDGLVLIDEINEKLHLNLASDNCDTISGFLIDIMGTIPNEGEDKTIEYENCIFKIQEVKEKRINKVELYIE